MSRARVAIRLRSADPAAVTGLLALRRSLPGMCPAALARYDLWDFEGGPGLEQDVDGILSRYTDILNPNKQERIRVPGSGLLPGEDPGLTWVSVEVSDDCSSASETWTSVISRAGYGVTSVSFSVMWRLGFDPSLPSGTAMAYADEIAVSRSRKGGLLSNPVSQSVRIHLASAPGEAAAPK